MAAMISFSVAAGDWLTAFPFLLIGILALSSDTRADNAWASGFHDGLIQGHRAAMIEYTVRNATRYVDWDEFPFEEH